MNHRIQGSEAWKEYRRGKINASEIAAIMGQDPWRTAMDIYLLKVDNIEKEPTEAMKRGTALEPYARRAYEEYTGLSVDPTVICHPQHDWLSASLDGITFDGKHIVEIKCPGHSSFQKIKDQGIPKHYWIQVQAQLFCSGAKEAHFFVFSCSDDLKACDFFMEVVKPDELFHGELLEVCHEFWFENVLKKIPPEDTGLAKSKCYEKIDDPEYFSIEERLNSIKEVKKRVLDEEEFLTSELKRIADGREVMGKYTRVCNVTRKGSIDEKLMKDKGLNPDEYRKASVTSQTVMMIKNEK